MTHLKCISSMLTQGKSHYTNERATFYICFSLDVGYTVNRLQYRCLTWLQSVCIFTVVKLCWGN